MKISSPALFFAKLVPACRIWSFGNFPSHNKGWIDGAGIKDANGGSARGKNEKTPSSHPLGKSGLNWTRYQPFGALVPEGFFY